MHKTIYLLSAVAVLTGLAACKKQTLMTYNAPDQIYFDNIHTGNRIDTTDFSFAFSPATTTDSSYYVYVGVTGTPRDSDRVFSIVVADSSTAKAGVDYQLPPTFVVRAGNVVDSFPVKFMRTSAMQTQAVSLYLGLAANSNFQTNLPTITSLVDSVGTLSFMINVSDMLTGGPYWTNVFATYFGTFSVKKLRLLNQVTGMALNYVIVGIYDLNLSARCASYAITMSRYLQDQQAAGTPVYEADGVTLMTMGATYQ